MRINEFKPKVLLCQDIKAFKKLVVVIISIEWQKINQNIVKKNLLNRYTIQVLLPSPYKTPQLSFRPKNIL